MKNTLLDMYEKEGTRRVLSSLISILVGLFVGAIVVVIVGLTKNTITNAGMVDGVKLIFAGIFCTGRDAVGQLCWGFNGQALGNMLFRAMPLILTGLSVAVANKTGLFNIGAPGQYLMGTMASLMIALSIPAGTMPGFLVWLLAFLGGMLAGAAWGAIPGALKAFLNINEVLACIMTNWLAANIVTWGFDVSNFKNVVENTKSGYVYKTTFGLTEVDGAWTYVNGNGVSTTKLGLDKIFSGSQVNAGILVAIFFAIAMYVLMNKTTLGYQLKACGSNRHAARYAGINDKRNIVLSMAMAGSLSAAGASLYWLSGNTEFFWSTYQSLPATGFNGIPVALLAVYNPIGVIFSGVFMAMLDIVGQNLTGYTAYNEYITDVIISVIVYLSAFSLMIQTMLPKVKKANAANANAEPAPNKEAEKEEGGESV